MEKLADKIMLGLLFCLLFMIISYPIICITNEYLTGWGSKVNYCKIVPATHANQLIESEFELVGIRVWRITNPVLGIYPTAKEAFNTANEQGCLVKN